MAPVLKLHYFDGKGRMEPLRWIAEAAGLTYSTQLISFAQWPDKKKSTPYGSMPVLEVDGVMLSETLAIARYLGASGGLTHSDPMSNAIGDEVVDVTASLVSSFLDIMLHGDDETEKKNKMETLMTTNMPAKFTIWEQRVKGKFLEGDKAMWQDIFMSHWLSRFVEAKPCLLQQFPKLAAVMNNVKNLDNLKKYLAKPCTYSIPL